MEIRGGYGDRDRDGGRDEDKAGLRMSWRCLTRRPLETSSPEQGTLGRERHTTSGLHPRKGVVCTKPRCSGGGGGEGGANPWDFHAVRQDVWRGEQHRRRANRNERLISTGKKLHSQAKSSIRAIQHHLTYKPQTTLNSFPPTSLPPPTSIPVYPFASTAPPALSASLPILKTIL